MEDAAAELEAAIAVISSGSATSDELEEAVLQVPLILEKMRAAGEERLEAVLKLARGSIHP